MEGKAGRMLKKTAVNVRLYQDVWLLSSLGCKLSHQLSCFDVSLFYTTGIDFRRMAGTPSSSHISMKE